jgi:P27 family predicted phage terminase small subunit
MRRQGGGTKHTPEVILAVQGKKSKTKARLPNKVSAPVFSGYFPPPPHVAKLEHAEATWKVTLPLLLDMGVITAADIDALCTYCVAVGIHRQASLQLAVNGITLTSKKITGEDMERKSPEIDIINTQAKIIQSFAGEFGLTPSSRARLNVTIPAENDPLAEFMSH